MIIFAARLADSAVHKKRRGSLYSAHLIIRPWRAYQKDKQCS